MTEPSVCAVMLTANRPEMARQAVECFRQQTYRNKLLLIWDTSDVPSVMTHGSGRIMQAHAQEWRGQTIGELRNSAIRYFSVNRLDLPDIIVHFDDDDYSHRNRIAEQVALLQSSGADCVGYNSMLFWREASTIPISVAEIKEGCVTDREVAGEAWLYSQPNPSYALGTSLCYWRKTWERRPFEATSVGEDVRFISGLKVAAVSSLRDSTLATAVGLEDPRMIARIHSGNTSDSYRPKSMARASEWKRVPEWDFYCRSVFEK